MIWSAGRKANLLARQLSMRALASGDTSFEPVIALMLDSGMLPAKYPLSLVS
nr:MAG TPA: hypothetical protein [Caudoviricetes sp.]